MSQLERQQQILDLLNSLKSNESMSVKQIAAEIFSSESSVRRDVDILVKKQLVTHIYGGVMLSNYRSSVMPVSVRDSINADVKNQIALLASRLVNDGDIIFLDSSSTVRRMIPYLKDKSGLRIITNNGSLLSEFSNTEVQLYCTGGKFNSINSNFLGNDAVDYIMGKNATLAFFSSQGLSENGDITDISEEETAIRKAMIKRSKRQVFLCDSTKIGIEKFTTVCNIKDITDIICDKPQEIDIIKKRIGI